MEIEKLEFDLGDIEIDFQSEVEYINRMTFRQTGDVLRTDKIQIKGKGIVPENVKRIVISPLSYSSEKYICVTVYQEKPCSEVPEYIPSSEIIFDLGTIKITFYNKRGEVAVRGKDKKIMSYMWELSMHGHVFTNIRSVRFPTLEIFPGSTFNLDIGFECVNELKYHNNVPHIEAVVE